jgi:hypothetical protein
VRERAVDALLPPQLPVRKDVRVRVLEAAYVVYRAEVMLAARSGISGRARHRGRAHVEGTVLLHEENDVVQGGDVRRHRRSDVGGERDEGRERQAKLCHGNCSDEDGGRSSGWARARRAGARLGTRTRHISSSASARTCFGFGLVPGAAAAAWFGDTVLSVRSGAEYIQLFA